MKTGNRRKIWFISALLMLFAQVGFAQCAPNELEIRVDINTDPYGSENYWTLTDLMGTIIMQGGQGGTFLNNSSYSDSICVTTDGCYFFEVYDGYGDGIYAPNGYALFVNDMLIASGSDDIGSYVAVTAHCPAPCSLVLDAMNDLQGHINETNLLSDGELTLVRNIFVQFPECLAENEAIILLGKSIIEDYDNQIGAIFTTPSTQYGFSKDPVNAPGFAVERASFALQQGIFDHVFTPEVYAEYPQHIQGWMFNTCYNFPGYVAPPADSAESHSVLIRANFDNPDGMNPYYDINGDGTSHALRPTGMYLSPGTVATVTVPDSLVGQDFYVRVGAHEWDFTNRAYFRRFDRISRKFPIDSTTFQVFNPFGGAISVMVPYGANDGIVTVSVTNAVEAPFFSLKSFYETPDFNAELSKPGPWAVFETDNVMFTIPKHSIVPGQYDLMQALLDWDMALQGVNSIIARQIVPDKHNMYMIADVDIRFEAYSIGYPFGNTVLDYTNVPGPAYFINGPGPDDETDFHESGHALALSKFPGEEEALVNFPYVMALNYGLGQDLNEAVNYSFVPNTFDIDKTAIHRMVSNTFGGARDITGSVNNEVRYQHRGYGHYFEIVNMLGWCPLRNFWRQEFLDFENGIDHGINDQNIDGRILRMSAGAQVDLRPLFDFFGILPIDPAALQDTFTQMGLLPSLTVYNRLQTYLDLLPQNNDEFVDYALAVYPNLYTDGPIEAPEYGVGWHYLKSLTYNEAESQTRTASLQAIIDLYFPNGAPTGNQDPDVCCLLDQAEIDRINEAVVVSGGVEPYLTTIDTTSNLITVTVVDFDGCTTSAEYLLSHLTEPTAQSVAIYPNPASTEITYTLTENPTQVAHLQIVTISGQVIKLVSPSDRSIDISTLSEGMYILQFELSNGDRVHAKFMVLR